MLIAGDPLSPSTNSVLNLIAGERRKGTLDWPADRRGILLLRYYYEMLHFPMLSFVRGYVNGWDGTIAIHGCTAGTCLT